MHVRLVGLTLLLPVLLIACSSTPTPTPPATPVALAPTLAPTATAVPSPAATATAQLVITLITPTPFPTDLPATATLSATGTITGSVPDAQPTTPPELGNSAADAQLVSILQSCWHVGDPRQLNGNNPAHRDAFDCARARLISLAQSYPNYGLVHRVIAWGYYYKDNNLEKAIAEYRVAANAYHQVNDASGESEARMRLGLLLIASSRSAACTEFALAGNLDSSNSRAIEYYDAYTCNNPTNPATGKAIPPPVLQVNLDQVRGKILFKTDREGVESVYVMNPDGSDQKKVASGLYTVAAKWESFSPDHSQVASVRNAGFTKKFGYDNDIWVTDPTGGSGRPLTNPADDYDPVWSPQGLFDGANWLAFVSNRGDTAHGLVQGEEIWIMHPDGTSPLRLTCHGPNFSKHPSWSADATRLVFGSNYPNAGNTQIYSMDMTQLGKVSDPCDLGDAVKNLSNNTYNDYQPIWVK